MKSLTAKSKIMYGIIILLIIIATIVVIRDGFNFSLKYQANQMIEIYIGKEINTQDIKAITDEVMGETPVILQRVEVYNDMIEITANEITEEQKEEIVNKINEKYSLELKAEDITIETIPHTRLRDVLAPYAIPFIISTLLILVYFGARYYKLGVIKVVLLTGINAVLAQLTAFSVIAITRIPIGEYTMAIILFVYTMSMLVIASRFEKKLAQSIENTEKEEEN